MINGNFSIDTFNRILECNFEPESEEKWSQLTDDERVNILKQVNSNLERTILKLKQKTA